MFYIGRVIETAMVYVQWNLGSIVIACADSSSLIRSKFRPPIRAISATLAASRTLVVWSGASLRTHRQLEEGPTTRPRVGLRSGQLMASSRRNYSAEGARQSVAAPAARNTGRLVVYVVLLFEEHGNGAALNTQRPPRRPYFPQHT